MTDLSEALAAMQEGGGLESRYLKAYVNGYVEASTTREELWRTEDSCPVARQGAYRLSVPRATPSAIAAVTARTPTPIWTCWERVAALV